MYVCSQNSPQYFSSTVVLRSTYILWATASTTGITMVNLHSRNTKQAQMMRASQQRQHSRSSKAAATAQAAAVTAAGLAFHFCFGHAMRNSNLACF